jgi:hypothetical protein
MLQKYINKIANFQGKKYFILFFVLQVENFRNATKILQFSRNAGDNKHQDLLRKRS